MQICVPFEMNQSVHLLNYGLGIFWKSRKKFLKVKEFSQLKNVQTLKFVLEFAFLQTFSKLQAMYLGKIKDKSKLVYLMSRLLQLKL